MTSITQFTTGKKARLSKALGRGCVSSAVLVALLRMAENLTRFANLESLLSFTYTANGKRKIQVENF